MPALLVSPLVIGRDAFTVRRHVYKMFTMGFFRGVVGDVQNVQIYFTVIVTGHAANDADMHPVWHCISDAIHSRKTEGRRGRLYVTSEMAKLVARPGFGTITCQFQQQITNGIRFKRTDLSQHYNSEVN